MPLEARAANFANPNPLGDGTHVERLLFFQELYIRKGLLLRRGRRRIFLFHAGYLRFYGEATTSSSYGGYGGVIHSPSIPSLSAFPQTCPRICTRSRAERCTDDDKDENDDALSFKGGVVVARPLIQAATRIILTSSNTSTTFPKDGRATQ